MTTEWSLFGVFREQTEERPFIPRITPNRGTMSRSDGAQAGALRFQTKIYNSIFFGSSANLTNFKIVPFSRYFSSSS
jgi:hypothetical protein